MVLTLAIDEGEFFGLVGSNVAGKTTTIKMHTTLIIKAVLQFQGISMLKQFENILDMSPKRCLQMVI